MQCTVDIAGGGTTLDGPPPAASHPAACLEASGASASAALGGEPEMTLAGLSSTFQDGFVAPETPMKEVVEQVRCQHDMIGAMVLDGSRLYGVISRELLARELARPFYRELCERRPVRDFLKIAPQSCLQLSVNMAISRAVEAAMARPMHERYEPIVVNENGGRHLLAVPVLLMAQCHALDRTLSALEKQRQATLAAERERAAMHEQLLVASRQAGRAEVATGVLHNVGNVLNSVNVSASVITRALETSKLVGLGKAVGLLEEHNRDLAPFLTTDERGQRLPGYLHKLNDALTAEHGLMIDELKSLAQGLDHIKQVVSMQQSYARDPFVSMVTRPNDLFEDALKVNLVSFERHKVTVTHEESNVPAVALDKHKVLQILINLIGNAKNAVKATGAADRRIWVSAQFDDVRHRLQFIVRDNGIGIAAENLTRIFSHGFTTSKEGHGFGLHSSATTAAEMGGTLTAHSDGLGMGATFVLDIPVTLPQAVR